MKYQTAKYLNPSSRVYETRTVANMVFKRISSSLNNYECETGFSILPEKELTENENLHLVRSSSD
jgi:hypothetical protein